MKYFAFLVESVFCDPDLLGKLRFVHSWHGHLIICVCPPAFFKPTGHLWLKLLGRQQSQTYWTFCIIWGDNLLIVLLKGWLKHEPNCYSTLQESTQDGKVLNFPTIKCSLYMLLEPQNLETRHKSIVNQIFLPCCSWNYLVHCIVRGKKQ